MRRSRGIERNKLAILFLIKTFFVVYSQVFMSGETKATANAVYE